MTRAAIRATVLLTILSGSHAVFTSACASASPRGESAANPTASDLDQALLDQYRAAIDVAKNPTPERVHRGLVAIVPDNPALSWREFDGAPHVLMVSWVSSFTYYESSVGQTYNTGNYDLWVTAAPFVRERCSDPAWRGHDLDLRLQQLLGLPPGRERAGFVEFWVEPDDLFRPCPDNEITDTQCDLALPPDVAPWYRSWFNERRASQYFVARDPEQPGWPWTQLGYTMDWRDLDDPIGVSEFVVKRDSDVRVQAMVSTDAYCHAH